MIWLMVWLVCGTTCALERVEQEFPTQAECVATLAWYQAHRGVVGTCRPYGGEDE